MALKQIGLDEVINHIKRFEPITLEEMDSVKLLNRTDTKFVFHGDLIPVIFERIREDYRVLEVLGNRMSRYRTLYFDTPDFRFYTLHQNGKKNRYKVRMREYIESNLSFLEIKFKNNKGRTVKSRRKIDAIEDQLSAESIAYITEVMGYQTELVPKLWNRFSRITLVSNIHQERLTLDFGLTFEFDGQQKNLPNVVIAEVKQAKASRNSTFVQALKELRVRPMRISKYCMGCLSLNPGLKYNNFKQKVRTLNKISYGVSA